MTRWKLKWAYLIDSLTWYFYGKYIIRNRTKIILQRKRQKSGSFRSNYSKFCYPLHYPHEHFWNQFNSKISMVSTNWLVHFKNQKFSTVIRLVECLAMAGFRPNSEIIGKFRKMEKFYDHFITHQKWCLQPNFGCVGVF